MKKLFTSSLILFFVLTNAQEIKYFDAEDLETTKDHYYYSTKITTDSSTYKIEEFYSGNKPKRFGVSTTNTIPYQFQGEVKTFFEDGKPESVSNYKNNVLDGKSTQYFQNQKVKSETIYLDGKKSGLETLYNENGILESKITYKDDKAVGPSQTFWENGQVKVDGSFTNGKYAGPYKEFFEDGKVSVVGTMKNNLFDGEYLEFHDNAHDVLKSKMIFKSGVQNGNYEIYFENGKLAFKGSALNNVQNGICQEYYENGKLKKEYTIANKKLNGPYKAYDNNGNQVAEGLFKEGIGQNFKVSKLAKDNKKIVANMTSSGETESWKITLDEKTILNSFYKKGYKSNTWNIYQTDGTTLIASFNYADNLDCGETYIQKVNEPFSPEITLSDRYSLDPKILEDKNCISNNEWKFADGNTALPEYF